MSLSDTPVGQWTEDLDESLSLKDTSIVKGSGLDEVVEANARGMGWSPDGKMLALPGMDKRVVVLDVETGSQVILLEGHRGPVSCVDWSPTGRWLASTGLDQRLIVWSTDTWKAVKERTVGLGYGHLRRGCNSIGGGPLRFAPTITWSSDGACLAAAGPDNRIFMWEGHSFSLDNILKLKKEKEATSAMGWSPDSLRLAVGTTLGELLMYESKRKAVKLQVHSNTLRVGPLTAISWCPSPRPILALTGVGKDRMVVLLNADTGTVLNALEGPEYRVYTCCWGPRGDWLATGGGDYKVTIWDTDLAKAVTTLDGGHQSWVGALSLSPDGRHLATVSQDHRLVLWTVRHKKVTQAIEDVCEVKRALEAAQGEKKDLQERFEQRESLIRLLEGELSTAKGKLSAARSASSRSVKSFTKLGARKSQDAMSANGEPGSPTRRASSKKSVARSDSNSSASGKKSPSRNGSMNGVNAEDVVVSTQDADLLDGVDGVQSVEEVDEPDGKTNGGRTPGLQRVKSAGSMSQPPSARSRGEDGGEEQAGQEGEGEGNEQEEEEEEMDPEDMALMLEQSVVEMETLKAELEEARRKEEELLDISSSQAKREKALVAELEQLKAAAATAAAIALKAQEDLEKLREQARRTQAERQDSRGSGGEGALSRSKDVSSGRTMDAPPSTRQLQQQQSTRGDNEVGAAPVGCLSCFGGSSTRKRANSKVAAGDNC